MVSLLKTNREEWRSDYALRLEIEALLESCGLDVFCVERGVVKNPENTIWRNQVWCHAKNEWDGEFFFSLSTENKNPDQAVCELITFLSSIEDTGSPTCIHVLDFGIWNPPPHLPISKIVLNKRKENLAKEEVALVIPSPEYRSTTKTLRF